MKKILLYLFITIILLTGCTSKKIKESDKVNTNVEVVINNKSYKLELENNKTTLELIKLLPLEITMNDLNNNEKYFYLDKNLPTEEENINNINKGDVMLFGNNCLVIFYKSFETSYTYTKIGHISNLEDLSNGSVKVIIKNS